MARVTAAEVKTIMDGCTIADAIIDTFIVGANEVITVAFSGNSDVSDTLLKELERWLTAHMIASTIYRTTSEEKIGDASAKYTGEWGKKLESTPYGQMVLILDTTGIMGQVGKAQASIYAVKSFDE